MYDSLLSKSLTHLSLTLVREWSEFYSTPYTANNSFYTSKTPCEVAKDSQTYIFHCYFIDMDNGAIYIFSDDLFPTTKVLIETCTFDKITSSGLVTTVYVAKAQEIIENKVCAKKSTKKNDAAGIYSVHFVMQNEANRNYVLESSFADCSSENAGCLLFNYYGDAQCSKTNISTNEALYSPCISFEDISTDAKISYSTFNNNTGHEVDNFCFYHFGEFKYFYSHCDIYNNKCQGAILGFVADCNISSCNFFDNTDSYSNYLFYIDDSYTLTTDKCYINNENARSSYPENMNLNLIEDKMTLVVGIKCKENVFCQIQQKHEECTCRTLFFHIHPNAIIVPVLYK